MTRIIFVSDFVGINPEGAQKVETSSKTICILYPCDDCQVLIGWWGWIQFCYWTILIARNCSEWRDCWSGILWKYEGLELYLLFVLCQTERKYSVRLTGIQQTFNFNIEHLCFVDEWNISMNWKLLLFLINQYCLTWWRCQLQCLWTERISWYSPHHK